MKKSIISVLVLTQSLNTKPDGSPAVDKRGNAYKRNFYSKPSRTFMEVAGVGNVEVEQKVRVQSINLYEKSYLPSDKGASEYGYNHKVGGFVFGDIVTAKVAKYPITSVNSKTGLPETKEVDIFTTVVFGNTASESWESDVARAFKSAGHPLASEIAAQPAVEVRDENPANATA